MTWIKEHKFIVSSTIVIAVCLGFLVVILVDMFEQKAASSSQNASVAEADSTSTENTESIKEGSLTENPFDNKGSNLSEDEILNYIHGMSHQKVKAEEKWIHYELTNERIQFLKNVVENGNFKNEDIYLDILNRWAEGDFSKADKDHNRIWNLQGGTIGKATDVLTAEEEQQYLEKLQGSIQ